MIVEVISLQLHSKKWTSKITVVTNSDICIHWQFLRAIFWCDLSIHQALSRLTPLPVIIFARQIFFSLNQRPCGNGSSGRAIWSQCNCYACQTPDQYSSKYLNYSRENFKKIRQRFRHIAGGSLQSGDSIKRKNEIREIKAGQMYHLVSR